MDTYFQGEKSGSLLFIAIGFIAIVVALLIFRSERFQRGVAIPLILVGLIQAAIGATVYLRTERQVSELKTVLQADPHVYKAQELIRMQRINRSFDVIKKIEIALLVAGLIVAFVFRTKNPFYFGIAVGLIIQSSISLLMDLFAERRADVYTSYLLSL